MWYINPQYEIPESKLYRSYQIISEFYTIKISILAIWFDIS